MGRAEVCGSTARRSADVLADTIVCGRQILMLRVTRLSFPALAGWANVCRPYGAYSEQDDGEANSSAAKAVKQRLDLCRT